MLYRLNKNPQQTSLIRLYDFSSISLNSTLSQQQQQQQFPQSKFISRYISRIMFYSLIPILAYFPSIILSLAYSHTNKYIFSLNLFSLICVSSQSIFTFIIFLFDPIIDEVILEHKRNIEHKKHVLDNIKKGVYVDNVYNIDRELPSNRDQNGQQDNNNSIKINKDRRRYRSTFYGYAMNAKNRISILTTTVLNNGKKSIEVKKDVFNLDNDDDEILSLL
ncbi:hypothetical protein RclHR1_02000015 [Rhizophagus clarus]|nr:hypothetical protein RclHR1_02000015 [Rhizophagus clarus]